MNWEELGVEMLAVGAEFWGPIVGAVALLLGFTSFARAALTRWSAWRAARRAARIARAAENEERRRELTRLAEWLAGSPHVDVTLRTRTYPYDGYDGVAVFDMPDTGPVYGFPTKVFRKLEKPDVIRKAAIEELAAVLVVKGYTADKLVKPKTNSRTQRIEAVAKDASRRMTAIASSSVTVIDDHKPATLPMEFTRTVYDVLDLTREQSAAFEALRQSGIDVRGQLLGMWIEQHGPNTQPPAGLTELPKKATYLKDAEPRKYARYRNAKPYINGKP